MTRLKVATITDKYWFNRNNATEWSSEVLSVSKGERENTSNGYNGGMGNSHRKNK
jgi:hypothetical protein